MSAKAAEPAHYSDLKDSSSEKKKNIFDDSDLNLEIQQTLLAQTRQLTIKLQDEINSKIEIESRCLNLSNALDSSKQRNQQLQKKIGKENGKS